MITILTSTKRIASGDEDMDSSEAPFMTALDLVHSDEEETYEEDSAGNKIVEMGIESLINRENNWEVGWKTDISRKKR